MGYFAEPAMLEIAGNTCNCDNYYLMLRFIRARAGIFATKNIQNKFKKIRNIAK
jgi:hypothetical protein